MRQRRAPLITSRDGAHLNTSAATIYFSILNNVKPKSGLDECYEKSGDWLRTIRREVWTETKSHVQYMSRPGDEREIHLPYMKVSLFTGF
jgi:hypothetical protein